jgi:hypothetical protein
MLKLNLIADEAKKELKMAKLSKLLTDVIIIVIMAFLAFSGITFYARQMLEIDMQNITELIDSINKNSESYNKKIQNFNDLIDRTQEIQSDYIPWNCFLGSFMVAKPGIQMQMMTIDKKTATMVIRGFASTRDNLLEYKASLEKNPLISQLDLPFNSLLNKTDINFEITVKINIKKINSSNF